MKEYNKVLVTEENMEEIIDSISAADQASFIKVGMIISTYPIIYEGGQRGQLTVYHDTDRAGIMFGGDSEWGDWDDEEETLTTEEGFVYNKEGDLIEEDEDNEDEE